MIKVKKTEPKEPAVNISLDEGTARELLNVLQDLTTNTMVGDTIHEIILELEEVL